MSMKVYLNDLESMKLYKNKQILFGNSSNKLKGNIILTNILYPDELKTTYKSNTFVNMFIRGYYHPRLMMLTSCRNKKISNVQKDVYSKIKTDYPTFKYTRFKLENYNSYNTYFDMNECNKVFNSVYGKYPLLRRINLFQNYFKELVSKVTDYDNLYINVIPSNMITTGREWSMENILYFLAKNNMIDEELFDRITFIFSSKNGKTMFFTKVSNEQSKKFDLVKYKRFCNIIYKLNIGLSLEDSEIDEIKSSDEDIKLDTKLATKEHIKKEIKATVKTKSNLSDKALDHVYKEIDSEVDRSMTLNKKEIVKSLNSNEEINQEISNEIKKKENASLNQSSKKPVYSKNISSDQIDYGKINNNIYVQSDIDKDNTNDDEDDSNLSISSDYIDFEIPSDTEVTVNQKQVEKLKAKQSQVVVNVNDKESTLDSVIESKEVDDIDIKEIKIDSLNDEIRYSTLKDFDRSYVQLQKDKDMYKIISAFNNDPECPIYVTGIKRENTSDSFNKKETLTISYEDANKKKHTVKIDVPIVIDNSFLYLNNGKKTISKQLNVRPIIKISPDEAIVTTNYSKVYISRYGQKLSPNIDKLKKFFKKDVHSTDKKIKFVGGNNIGTNSKFGSSIEYDELSNTFVSITINTLNLNFNRIDVIDFVNSKLNIDVENILHSNEFALGYDSSSLDIFVIDTNTSNVIEYNPTTKKKVKDYSSIFDLITLYIKNYNPEYYQTLLNENISKKFMYSRISVLNNKFPLIVLLGFYFGMENVLERYNVKFELLEKKKKPTDSEMTTENMIQFKDGFLYYDNTKFSNSILLSGLTELNTKEIEFISLNKKESYYEIFENLLGNRQITKGLNNFLSLFLDPITIEILEDLKLPTDLLDIFLYVNDLLTNNLHSQVNDMHNYRVRSIELINDELYLLLANSVKEYKDAYKAGRTEAKINVKQDQLIKNLLESQIIDSYSTLNPVLEIEKLGTSNYKGLGGTNKDTAFTPAIRSYDKSMVGLLGMSSPDSNKVGIVRQISMSPSISTTRGIINPPEDVNELNATNMFTVGELLSSYTSTHADPPRIGMETQQNKHSVPTKLQSRPLYGSGVERSLPYMLSSDFVDVAEEDGVVEKIDKTNELVILRYNSGKTKVIDISDKQSYNGNGGLTM